MFIKHEMHQRIMQYIKFLKIRNFLDDFEAYIAISTLSFFEVPITKYLQFFIAIQKKCE